MAQLKSKREQKKQERDDRVQAMHRAHPDIADVDARMPGARPFLRAQKPQW